MIGGTITMSDFIQQLMLFITFYLRNEYYVAEKLRMLQQAFGDEVMSPKILTSDTQTKKGKESIKDDQRPRRP